MKSEIRNPKSQIDEIHETVLVALCGLSPAVITETVWALARQRGIVPDRVFALTTEKGAAAMRAQLFQPQGKGGLTVWEDLRQSLGAGPGQLIMTQAPHHLRVFTDRRGEPLADISTEEQNMAVADFMAEALHGLAQADTRLVVSIAGGFKTMSALMMAALSLVGRPWDQANHALVRDEAVGSSFYFPGQSAQALTGRGGVPLALRAEDVEITLMDVPFISLRRFLDEKSLGAVTFTGLKRQIEQALAPEPEVESLTVYRGQPVFTCNGRSFSLKPREHLLLLVLADMARNLNTKTLTVEQTFNRLKKLWPALQSGKIPAGRDADFAPCRAWIAPSKNTIETSGDISRMKHSLTASLKPPGVCPALAAALRQPSRLLGLNLPPERVSLVDHAPPEVQKQAGVALQARRG